MTRRTTTLVLALCFAVAATAEEKTPEPASPRHAVTGGAAPGYVADRVCTACHGGIARTYREVGMARSFYRPGSQPEVEDFGDVFYHAASQRYYAMRRDGEGLVFRRWQVDGEGEAVNAVEIPVDWILGSGNHARTYLYQTAAGDLFQLPLAWYAESGWGMAPGFDKARHQGLTRRVRRECMFCHNAYPDVPAGADEHSAPHVFPRDLPEGTGCQRCHGPGAEHVRRAETSEDYPAIRAAITNPGKLEPARRDEVCASCHLQPSVALFGVRRFGVGDYAFRPGQPLASYLVQMDVDEDGQERSERFEINHHPYRLRQSRCFEESEGALSCLTCHDPHRKVPPAERAAHYRAACLTCHTAAACRLAAMRDEASDSSEPAGLADVDPGDCAACHMAKRRPRDVVQVVMTDHLIRRRPGGPELVAPREETDPVLVGVELLDPEGGPAGDLGEIYKAVAVMRAGGNPSALAHLEKMLRRSPQPEPEPWLDLAEGLLDQGHPAAAASLLAAFLERFPGHALGREWLAVAKAQNGEGEDAVALLEGLVEEGPERAEAHVNLGLLLEAAGRLDPAVSELEQAVELRPTFGLFWLHLARVQGRLGRTEAAARSRARALALEPLLGSGSAGPGTSSAIVSDP